MVSKRIEDTVAERAQRILSGEGNPEPALQHGHEECGLVVEPSDPGWHSLDEGPRSLSADEVEVRLARPAGPVAEKS